MKNLSQQEREFNATAAGQREMCNKASRVGLALMINRKVAQLGGTAWSDAMLSQILTSQSDQAVQSIIDDLVNDFNHLSALSVPIQKPIQK